MANQEISFGSMIQNGFTFFDRNSRLTLRHSNYQLHAVLCKSIIKLGRNHVACVQTSPLPQEKSGEETSVNRRR